MTTGSDYIVGDRAMEEAEELELDEIDTISDSGHNPDELPEIVLKPNTTAPVWKHFGFESDVSGKPVNTDCPLCRVCCQDIGAKEGNTMQ